MSSRDRRPSRKAKARRGGVGPRPLSLISSRSQLSKVAQLYYTEETSQYQIAKRMNVSVASVSRALDKARKLGIVRITIHADPDDFSQLEIALEQAFGLNECLLVPSFDQIDHVYAAMARALAEVLGRVLRRGDTLGLSWGETLKAMGENMPALPIGGVDVVPITGALGMIDTGIYPSSLARAFAEKIGGTPYLINTPAIVGNEAIRRSLMSDSSFQQIREIWRRLSVVILGAGGVGKDTSMYRAKVFNADELESIQTAGGAAACNFYVFDEAGQPVRAEVADRVVKLPLGELRHVEHRIVIAAGRNKANALRAVLRSKVANTLITDVDCAKALLPQSGEATTSALPQS
ncbi:MAG TPA: sugar-binding domain-containing protein [Anaeromyxobacteraceae bacterium]|nr:sugar-binding domain-containing protein [Anaeromyxobacteraceae bacterium]